MDNIAIIKVPKECAGMLDKEVGKIGEAIGGTAFVVPHEVEVILGDLAKTELDKIHEQIHELLGVSNDR